MILGDADEELQATITRIPAHGVPELGYCPSQAVTLAIPDEKTDVPLSQNNSLEDLKSFLVSNILGRLYDQLNRVRESVHKGRTNLYHLSLIIGRLFNHSMHGPEFIFHF